MKASVLLVLAGCGRIWFDPIGADDDGGLSVVGLPPGETCSMAPLLGPGTVVSGSMAGAANDHINSCGGDGIDVVYRLDVSAAGHRVFVLPTFDGALDLTNMCPPTTSFNICSSLVGGTMRETVARSTGTTYVVIDKTGGAGSTFDLTIE